MGLTCRRCGKHFTFVQCFSRGKKLKRRAPWGTLVYLKERTNIAVKVVMSYSHLVRIGSSDGMLYTR
jgi:hypothetical protein